MVKNIKGGNKAKRGKNSRPPRQIVTRSKDDNYAQIVSNLGNGRLAIKVIKDNGAFVDAQGIIRGTVRRCFFSKDDIVLVQERDYEKNTYDICIKYNPDQVQQLIHSGEIPSINNVSGSVDIIFSKENNDYNLYESSDQNKLIFDNNNDNDSLDSDSESNSKPEEFFKVEKVKINTQQDIKDIKDIDFDLEKDFADI
jgi:initiation factor 1A